MKAYLVSLFSLKNRHFKTHVAFAIMNFYSCNRIVNTKIFEEKLADLCVPLKIFTTNNRRSILTV